ncbi:MAG: PEP-CTERM sorting domain-containing protein [Phycisphaerales bacterium]|nr:PEP-CTERM sorting domain-containing protein [Phycisphaerales bacterium]
MRNKFALCAVAAFAAILLVVQPAAATPLIGNDWATGTLYDINPNTGAASNPRATGVPNLTGISLGPDGFLYGIMAASPGPARLHKINPSTGASIEVGVTNKNFVTEGDIDFDPISGLLFAIQETESGNDRSLFTVNPNDASTAEVGIISNSSDLSAMAFDAAGDLWVIDTAFTNDKLHKVNKATGAIMSTVALSQPLGAVAGMDFDPASGILYVADGFTDGTDQLFTLNTTTGLLTAVGPTGLTNGLAGLEFVPEPASLTLLLVGAFACTSRRRR